MIYAISTIGALVFAGFGTMLAKWLHLEGPAFYFLVILMGALGLTGSALVYYFIDKRNAKKEAAAAGGGQAKASEDTDAARWVRDANARLAQSKSGLAIENLPMVFVVGDRGTAKTSVILNSGFEPELLAGQVYQDNVVAPTRGANIFYGHETVFVEAGGTLLANPGAWKNLVVKLRPGRLKSLVGGGGQAPRGILLCFDLEAFSRKGAAESIAAAARYIQERLGDVSQTLGISFPVYVLFTRADRLPFFTEYVRNLGPEETGQVVGATLPMRTTTGGVYAEAETQRLNAAFNQLFHSLCDQRLRLLARESDPQAVPAAYEFPREFSKLRTTLVQFLVDVGRPSQIRVSPFLRGFYFSGVRPIQVQESAPVPQAQNLPTEAELGGGGATRMFRVGFQAEQRAQQIHASAQGGGGRRIPQWLFLSHLFHDVILSDAAARAASGASVKTSLTKRILWAAGGGLCLLYAILLVISYFGNSSMEDRARVAATSLAPQNNPMPIGGNLPSEDSLRRLDALRQSLQEVTDYETEGKPLHLRWGLYRGTDMIAPVRKAYYAKFRQILFGDLQDGMLSFLQRTPATPGPTDDYSAGYDTLKGYLLTTSEWTRSKDPTLQSFLAGRLLSRWTSGRESQIGDARTNLAKAQFDFYARDLHNGNPYSSASDQAAVDRGRIYLSKFTGTERVYRFLVSEVSKGHDPTTFNKEFPSSAEVLVSSVPVSYAYTKDGWKLLQDQIRKANYSGEQWVLGPYSSGNQDKAALEKGIIDLYTADYIRQWRDVMRGSNVRGYGSPADAAQKLDTLAGANAPLLALFWWTSRNTAIPDLPAISDKFKAVQAVVPPSEERKYIVQPNQGYSSGLGGLQIAVSNVAKGGGPDAERAMHDAADSAERARKDLSLTLPPDPDGHLEQRSAELLDQPIKSIDALGAVGAKGAGQQLCAAFNQITRKFPFDAKASQEVDLKELTDILQPGMGKLWMTLNGPLKSAVQCQNGQCKSTGAPPLSGSFLSSLGQLTQFSKALYGESGAEPKYAYTLKPETSDQIDTFNFLMNGQNIPLKGGAQKSFEWPGAGTRNFNLNLKYTTSGGLDNQPYEGLWSVFHFFKDAVSNTPQGAGYAFSWKPTNSGRDVIVLNKALSYKVDVETPGAPNIFRREFLSNLRCVGP